MKTQKYRLLCIKNFNQYYFKTRKSLSKFAVLKKF